MHPATSSLDVTLPTAADVQLAAASASRLSALNPGGAYEAGARLTIVSNQEEVVEIPASALVHFQEVLAAMGDGNSVAVVPVQAELTTQQAADLLNVSRPFLVEQLDKGVIRHRLVGKHRRIALADLLEYKRSTDKKRLAALDELSEIDQRLDLGYR